MPFSQVKPAGHLKLGFCMLKPSAGVSWLDSLPSWPHADQLPVSEGLNLPEATLAVVHILNGCKILRI